MLSKQSALIATFFVVISISVNREATAAVVGDVEDAIFDATYVDDDYAESDYVDRKFKRQITTGNVDGIMPQLSPQKVKELLRILNKPKKSEVFKLNGWSASGMPFNVLYTPNSLQQKFLTPPERKQLPVPQPLRRENLPAEPREDKKEYLRPAAKAAIRSPHMRKHYLVIPQLFVSYGWGSLGK